MTSADDIPDGALLFANVLPALINDASFRAEVRDDIATHAADGHLSDDQWQRFAASLFYQRMDFTRPDDYRGLADRLAGLDRQLHLSGGLPWRAGTIGGPNFMVN